MRKEGLVEHILSNKASGLESKAAATRALQAVLAAIETGIKKDGEVQLVGFGTFKIKSRPARKGRNPGTGEVIKIKASKTVNFKCGSDLKAIAGKARPSKYSEGGTVAPKERFFPYGQKTHPALGYLKN